MGSLNSELNLPIAIPVVPGKVSTKPSLSERIRSAFARFYNRVPPVDAAAWHPWYLFLPARSITGEPIFGGYVWRRLVDGSWQYQPRDMEHDRNPGDW